MKNVIFADNKVGLECVRFLLENYIDDISYIVVTDEISLVYKYLIKINFNIEKIIFNSDVSNKLFTQDKKIFDYFLLLWWPFILKKDIFSIPKYGTINTHPSLLPYNRGKHYNFWNIVEDVPFGVTLHFINQDVDSGDIVFQNKIEKTWEDTGESLYYKAQESIIELFIMNYSKICAMNYTIIKQNLDEGTFHYAKELDSVSKLDLDRCYTARELLNLLRARTFTGHPKCFFEENGKEYEVEIKIKEKK